MESYLGEIRAFAGNYAPQDWLICDGRTLNINDYQTLYALIGTTYGGNGVSQFALPDLQGRLMVNRGQIIVNNVPGNTYVLGVKAGYEQVALTLPNIPAHNHTLNASTQDATTNIPDNNILAAPIDTGTGSEIEMYLPVETTGVTNVELNNNTIGSNVGGNQPHNNLMPYVCISYIICTNGLYPSFQ